jgi:TPP-dependent pyruvate/acetoin dehydrogenase alpha subunit
MAKFYQRRTGIRLPQSSAAAHDRREDAGIVAQGKISKWFSGIGQEAISVGCTLALQHDEWIMPLHRNLGVFTSRQMPLHKLFMQWQGNKEGYSKGAKEVFILAVNRIISAG